MSNETKPQLNLKKFTGQALVYRNSEKECNLVTLRVVDGEWCMVHYADCLPFTVHRKFLYVPVMETWPEDVE